MAQDEVEITKISWENFPTLLVVSYANDQELLKQNLEGKTQIIVEKPVDLQNIMQLFRDVLSEKELDIVKSGKTGMSARLFIDL